jgi:osmotically inducible protein OsmC
MDKINPLFTATATATGGRNGHTESSDGMVEADLSVPQAMGGPGKPGTATPEHLFAAGYAACFGSALDYIAKQHKKDATKAKVICAVSIGPREGGGFGLAVKLHVEDKWSGHHHRNQLPQVDLATDRIEATPACTHAQVVATRTIASRTRNAFGIGIIARSTLSGA